MRKIRAILRIIRSEKYILITDKRDEMLFDLKMSEFEVKRYCLFIYNFLEETGAALDEVNEIINR